MARDPKQLRKAYEIKIGKDRADKLSDDQIGLLSKFYNQLSESEQSDIDSQILKGYNDTPLHQMAEEFISEKEDMPEDTSASVATAIEEDEDEEDDDDDFEPLGLEELLGDIREEGKKENALTLYEGTRQDDLVDEEIDERILRLLGLEDVFDIDYSTYLTLLKEKMVAARMTDSELSTEESELLTNEFKRVKGKVGRFTVKKKKINISESGIENKKVNADKLLKPAKIDDESQEKLKSSKKKISKEDNLLTSILESVKSIHKILKDKLKFDKKVNEDQRKYLEREQRKKRESKLETKKEGNKFLKGLKSSLPKLGIFDKIFNFLKNIILGRIVFDMIKWMSDPKNKGKLDNLFKFLSDWWPALTAAFIAFATPLGSFIRAVVSGMAKLTLFLLRFAARNPIAAGLIATGIAGTALALRSGKSAEKILEEGDKEDASPKEKAEELSKPFNIMNMLTRMALPSLNEDKQGFSGGGLVQGFTGGGLADTLSQQYNRPLSFSKNFKGAMSSSGGKSPLLGFSGGGFGTDTVPAMLTPGEFGTDTVPAMLTPGEFVMSKGAVDKFGVGTMMAMNKEGGGTNKPKLLSGLTLAQDGGLVKGSGSTYGQGLNRLGNPIKEYPNYKEPTDSYGKFYKKIYDAAKAAGDPFPEVVAAQAVEESNFGKSPLAIEANNLFGQDAPPSYPASQKYEYIDPVEGKHIAIKFSSIDESIKYRVNTWKQYYGDAKTPAEAIRNIAKSGYNPHEEYPGKIDSLLKDFGVDPNKVRPFELYKSQKTDVNVPNQSPGPKGFIESLTDEQGLSGLYMKPLNTIFGNQSSNNIAPSGRSILIPDTPQTGSIRIEELPAIKNMSNNTVDPPKSGQLVPQFPVISSSSVATRANKIRSLTGGSQVVT